MSTNESNLFFEKQITEPNEWTNYENIYEKIFKINKWQSYCLKLFLYFRFILLFIFYWMVDFIYLFIFNNTNYFIRENE